MTLAATTALLIAGGGVYALLIGSDSARSQAPPPANAAVTRFSSLTPFVAGTLSNGTAKLFKVTPGISAPAFATPPNSSSAATTLLTSDGEQLCTVIEVHGGPGAVGCGPLPRFSAKEVAAGVMLAGPHQYLVSGAVPDGIRDIVVRGKDGTSTAVEAKSNTFNVLLNEAPTQVSWTDATGTAHQANTIDPTR